MIILPDHPSPVVPVHRRSRLLEPDRVAQRVPDDERDAPRASVTNIDTQQIRRKPVLGGLINEYMHAA